MKNAVNSSALGARSPTVAEAWEQYEDQEELSDDDRYEAYLDADGETIKSSPFANALSASCRARDPQAVAALLIACPDLDVNQWSDRGASPLHEACLSGCVGSVNALLEAGADPGFCALNEERALRWAARCALPESALICQLLIDYGADIEHRDSDGLSAFLASFWHKSSHAARALAQAGADWEARCAKGLGVFDYARKRVYQSPHHALTSDEMSALAHQLAAEIEREQISLAARDPVAPVVKRGARL